MKMNIYILHAVSLIQVQTHFHAIMRCFDTTLKVRVHDTRMCVCVFIIRSSYNRPGTGMRGVPPSGQRPPYRVQTGEDNSYCVHI